jgi:thiamine-phosphate pyrophosphorylase
MNQSIMHHSTPPQPLVIAITPPEVYRNEHEALLALANCGISYIHVRKPGIEAKALKEYLADIPKHLMSLLALHGEEELVREFGMGGVHIKNHNTLNNNVLLRLTKSCHLIKEVAQCQQDYDYVFLSPVFDSISKSGYLSTMEHDEVERFLRHPKRRTAKVVALGGINERNVPKIKSMGFDGFALLGSLWHIENNSIDSEKTVQNLKNTLAAWNNPLY